MESKTKTRTNAPALSIYLGDAEESARRLAAIEGMANSLGVSRSKLFAMIADGQIALVVPGPGAAAVGQVIEAKPQ
jgi:hypothetical protein